MNSGMVKDQDTQPAKKHVRQTHEERTDRFNRQMLEATHNLILDEGTKKTMLKEIGARINPNSTDIAESQQDDKETSPALLQVKQDITIHILPSKESKSRHV